MKEYLGKTEAEVRKIFDGKTPEDQTADLIKVARMGRFDPVTGDVTRGKPKDLHGRVLLKIMNKIASEKRDEALAKLA